MHYTYFRTVVRCVTRVSFAGKGGTALELPLGRSSPRLWRLPSPPAQILTTQYDNFRTGATTTETTLTPPTLTHGNSEIVSLNGLSTHSVVRVSRICAMLPGYLHRRPNLRISASRH